MSATLQPNTVQTVRSFLGALDVPPSAYSSSDEVLQSLIAQVRAHRDDPRVRARLEALIETLALRDAATGEGLPSPACETVDARALAEELARLLGGDGATGEQASAHPAVLAAAALLVGATLQLGCATTEPATGSSDLTCTDDVSADNFVAMVEDSDLLDSEIDQAVEEFDDLSADDQEQVIEELCGMSPDEIAQYIIDNFDVDGGDDDVGDDDAGDDDAAYKGIVL